MPRSVRRPASRTPIARRTGSWPRCCPVPGRRGSGSPHTAAGTLCPPERLGSAVRALSAALRAGWPPVRAPAAAAVEYRLVDGAPWTRAAHLHRRPPFGRADQRRCGARREPAAAAGGARGLPRAPPRMQPRRDRRRGGARRAGGVTARLAADGRRPRGSPSAGSGRPSDRAGDRGRPAFSRPPACPSTVDWPSGSTRSWPCCGGYVSTPRCCCTTAGRPRASGSRAPRSICSAGCCSTPPAPGASSTPSPGRCGGRTSWRPWRGRPSSAGGSSRGPTPSRDIFGCSTPRSSRMRCAAERVPSVGRSVDGR